MSVNVIGGSIGGVENLSSVLNDFDVHFVSDKYSNKADILLMDITKTFNLDGKIKTGAKSLWPQYCKTIVSTATFLSQFDDYAKMLQWINTFYNDEKSMAALPLVISEEIFGFRFALAGDFLKELGFVNYGKPDVHIKEILFASNFILGDDTPNNVPKGFFSHLPPLFVNSSLSFARRGLIENPFRRKGKYL